MGAYKGDFVPEDIHIYTGLVSCTGKNKQIYKEEKLHEDSEEVLSSGTCFHDGC